MIRNNRILLFALLLLLPFVFPSCESEPAQVKVRLEGEGMIPGLPVAPVFMKLWLFCRYIRKFSIFTVRIIVLTVFL